MGSLLRRTWAPRGRTPVLSQQGVHRQKVSIAAALCLSPLRDRLRLSALTLADAYFDNWSVAGFLEAMLQGLEGRFVVIWDGGNMDKGDPIRELRGRFADRLSVERLPAYAPELSPIECLWSWLKYSRLSNYAPHDVRELEERAVTELASIRDDQAFLRNLFHASELPLPRTLLF